ncbi:copper homeostasis protein CutC [Mucilaginibacter phyllosphaerae]|uniref:PF03932 family protein CutC n=1 Tax=Mucilaginibacter phyllosphaerae TaxID=1812349 RepID=A0A4Y8AJI9_9SPHI|nr:copper homeostasis protein CutC [Mucilaginibacter phyllosphaerae]MBB3968332.1 copper homeostasis protein [Mucilaginibacter phyllosphaerae]TEW68669.1 copper homeostasis protein CutC [Mucilaginibacter phyllosphaerae]GGG99652.1 copper homeostasis protein CutC [Mucilaginibacter phyllosphaerae]
MNSRPQPVTLEVCSNSVTSAVAAQDGGAVRIELCENLAEGGTTPSYGQIILARKHLHIKLYVLIRPRRGDFLYTDLEFEVMKADIRTCIEAGCDGVVIGMLKADGNIDVERCTELVRMARQWGLGVTFHRAFDMCADQYVALEEIISMGCERILTSGGKTTAMEGATVINHLIEKAAGRTSIMPGSGITESNVADLVHFTGAKEVHSSARINITGGMQYKNDHILMSNSIADEYNLDVTSSDRVKAIINAANS